MQKRGTVSPVAGGKRWGGGGCGGEEKHVFRTIARLLLFENKSKTKHKALSPRSRRGCMLPRNANANVAPVLFPPQLGAGGGVVGPERKPERGNLDCEQLLSVDVCLPPARLSASKHTQSSPQKPSPSLESSAPTAGPAVRKHLGRPGAHAVAAATRGSPQPAAGGTSRGPPPPPRRPSPPAQSQQNK